MTEKQYKEYGELLYMKEKYEKQLNNLLFNNSSYEEHLIIEQPNAWLDLTYGNGSWRANICDDKDIMLKIKNLIESELNYKIIEIKQEMKNL